MSLPNKLKACYKGAGGKSKNEAALKVQALFNIMTRSFSDLYISESRESEESYLKVLLGILQEKDLVIFDLGYFNKDFFKKAGEKGSYYISRIRRFTAFYCDMQVAQGKPLPIDNIFDSSKDLIDIHLCIGQDKKTRISVRLIAAKLPPNVVNERIRKANKRARGRTLPHKEKTILSWNIVITNAEEDKLPSQLALELYKIRWQIELIFKAWKSYLNFRNIAHGGRHQVECMIYGRLIIIALLTNIYSRLYALILYEKDRELSMLKFFSLLQHRSMVILEYANIGTECILKLASILSTAAMNSLCDKRKRKTTLEIVTYYSNRTLENCG